MNILFLSLGNVNSSFYGRLALYFKERGHFITMISPSAEMSYDKMEKGIRSILFKSIPLNGGNQISKGLANILLPIICFRVVKKTLKKEKIDIVLSSTPPIAFYLAIEYVKKHNLEVKHYLILRDIWPEAFNLYDFEKRHPLIYSFFRKQERRLYSTSDIIGCMSEGNIEFVSRSNPETKNKLRLLYNWGGVLTPMSQTINIRQKYNLQNKFVLIYGGNMGVPQGLENIIELANWVKEKSDVVFVLIGKGEEKDRIKRRAENLSLSNVRFYDFLPKSDYELFLNSCDVGLISLNDKLKTPSIPSKTISYWNLRKPILAIVDHSTDYGTNIIDKSRSGLWAFASDKEQILSNFESLYSNKDLRVKLGTNGYDFFLKECSVEKTYERIMKQLYEL